MLTQRCHRQRQWSMSKGLRKLFLRPTKRGFKALTMGDVVTKHADAANLPFVLKRPGEYGERDIETWNLVVEGHDSFRQNSTAEPIPTFSRLRTEILRTHSLNDMNSVCFEDDLFEIGRAH